MKRSIAELITRDPEKFAHHDRVFKNCLLYTSDAADE